ncbi:MAG: hypothetical protein JW891_18165 [Candidatus Lokiarchaeota archaeon]|nr:hypothetical protein [Candidatus Lokiarchaeota archaeon]
MNPWKKSISKAFDPTVVFCAKKNAGLIENAINDFRNRITAQNYRGRGDRPLLDRKSTERRAGSAKRPFKAACGKGNRHLPRIEIF